MVTFHRMNDHLPLEYVITFDLNAQVDFGEALAEIAGVERKIHFFAMDLPHGNACFFVSLSGADRRRRKPRPE